MITSQLRADLTEYNQLHTITAVESGEASQSEAACLLDDLGKVDFRLLKELVGKSEEVNPEEWSPVPSPVQIASEAAWYPTGLQAVASGEVAACVLAGGLGTRLGLSG
eukprot:CAMPEP_0204330806 /NCGR_PEP_ID=MMETSP0469-20131031/15219_1 /ASSEMBLY_ACC=CAM_ASM_000384 /TAXON_ID=2969 /ORGANISM="Oxyrrhis marina" /LENGTH=107 /DNA_ID=CAMNT_0051313679 /DNA_START=8 /DNA_END=327 /DNA_ORIENTATION=-